MTAMFDAIRSPIDVDTLLNAVNELVDHPTQQNLEVVSRLLGEAPNVKEFLSGPAVVSIKSGQIKPDDRGRRIPAAVQWIKDWLRNNRQSGEFIHPQIGIIHLSAGGIKAAMSHKPTELDIQAVPAIPGAIEKSIVLDISPDDLGKPIENTVIAAPIEMDGQRYHLVMRLRRDTADKTQNPRFYTFAIAVERDENENGHTPSPVAASLEGEVGQAGGYDRSTATSLMTRALPSEDSSGLTGGRSRLLNVLHRALGVNDTEGFDSIDTAAHQAATSPHNDLPEPTDAQKLAGNYKVGRIRISGLDIAIENPAGSTRSGVDADGNEWSNTMQHHYGYVNGSHGADGNHVDVFVVPDTPEDYAGPVFVIDQINPDTGEFDEHKCVIGAANEDSAVAAYLANYDEGWLGMGGVTELPFAAFKSWVLDGKKRGPLGSLPGYDDIGLPAPSMTSLLNSIIGFSGSRADAQVLAIQLGIRLPSNQADVDLFGEPVIDLLGGDLFGGDDEQPPDMPVLEVPLRELGLSTDVPQFKSGADDDTGVVEPLGGKFDRTGVAPIQVWKRRDGRMEVISGRHRLDLARRSGERTIPAQVHHEDRGFDARKAAMLDAELNIRDGQGKVRDYIDYFTHSGIDEGQATDKGLLARSIGQRAFAIATQGSEDLIAAHRAEIISDQAAADIAALAPGNAAMQAVGIRAIQEGKPIQTAVNTMRAVIALARESGQGVDTMDLFGFDDSALKEAEAMARIASRKQRQVNEQLAAIKGAAKRPELARKQGVQVEDQNAVRNRVIELTALKHRWDSWSSHSDLLAEIRAEISRPGFDGMVDDDYWLEATDAGLYDAAVVFPASDEENIIRGEMAMKFVMDHQADFPHAMYRKDLGWIDFIWGTEGKPPTSSGKRKGAKGVAHILEARQRKDGMTLLQGKALVLKLVEVIAKGTIIRNDAVQGHAVKAVALGPYEAVLVKEGAGNEWLLSGWDTTSP